VLKIGEVSALASVPIKTLRIEYGRRGKLRLRDQSLDMVPWRGDEDVLDVGCGKGLLLIGRMLELHPAFRLSAHCTVMKTALRAEVFRLHELDLAVSLDDDRQAFFLVEQDRLADASIEGLADHSPVLRQDAIDVFLRLSLHSVPCCWTAAQTSLS
jgi:hypothetical protein